MEQLPKNLKFLRELFKLKQAEIQYRLDIKRTTWVGYEKGTSQPYLKEFVRIASFFKVSETDLLHADLSAYGNLILKQKDGEIFNSGKIKGNRKDNLITKKHDYSSVKNEPITSMAAEENALYTRRSIDISKIDWNQPPANIRQQLLQAFNDFIINIFSNKE